MTTRMITLTDAGSSLGLSAERARQLILSNPDLGRKVGGRWRINPDRLQALILSRGLKRRKEMADVPA